MEKKRILQYFLLLMPVVGLGQNNNDTVYTKRFPLKEGRIPVPGYMKQISMACPQYGIDVYSKEDTIRHFADAVVCAIFSIGNGKAVILKNTDSTFVTYAGLRQCFFLKGDKITKGATVGLLVQDKSSGMYGLDMIVSTGLKDFSYKQTLKYMRSYRLTK